MKPSKDTIRRGVITNLDTGLRVREAAEGEAPSRTITGYAILFGVPSEPLWEGFYFVDLDVVDEKTAAELPDAFHIHVRQSAHDRQLILARSNRGKGTLSYGVDEKGVYFEFEAPKTADGDKALEGVRRGDISGCSFAFSTRYWDRDFVERKSEITDNFKYVTYTVKVVTGIYDFTLAADPAYPETSVEAQRDLRDSKDFKDLKDTGRDQVREMRRAADCKIF